MELGLAGKIGIVTGASGGIGRAISLGLAKEGVKLALCDRDKATLDKVSREVAGIAGNTPLAIPVDFTNDQEVKTMVAKVISQYKRVDLLANAFAYSSFAEFSKLSMEEWLTITNVKYFGYVRCIQEVIPHMVEQKYGRIVNISGRSGKEPSTIHLPDSGVNAAVNAVTKGLAIQYGSSNIRVNAVAPGPVNTSRMDKMYEALAKTAGISVEQMKVEWRKTVPLGRPSEPSEIADTVVYLLSDRASYITGALIAVDGGGTRGV